MSLFNLLVSYLLPMLHPEVLKIPLAFLVAVGTAVAWTLPLKATVPLLILLFGIAWVTGALVRAERFARWHTNATERANQSHSILASQPEVDLEAAPLDSSKVDLEAEPLDFPRMPDMLEVEYNPWSVL